MYGLQGGAVNLILLLVSDIDDNFWFLTGHSTEKLVIIKKTSFVTTPPPPPPPSPHITQPLPSLYKAAAGRGCSQTGGPLLSIRELELAGFTRLRRRTVRGGET